MSETTLVRDPKLVNVVNKLKINEVSNIDNVDVNTFKEADNFFSYRRSQQLGEPDYGRCISTICLKT